MDNKSYEPNEGGAEGFTKSTDSLPPATIETTSLNMPKDMQKETVATKPYAGMCKDDLLRFSQTPFWNRLRTTCLILFWLGWAGLLAAVIALTVVAPRCVAPPQQSWWQRSVFYQIYVRSFFDSDSDGIGDIRGVISKLDYIESLHAEGIVLSAFYPSHYSHSDRVSNMGYDVTNHTAIDPDYGTMDDFVELLNQAHKKDIKVLIDFVPNHTGDKHPWFAQSSTSSDPTNNPYWNYYVWGSCPAPTNWRSVYGSGSAWVNDTVGRSQCYLNQFLPHAGGAGGGVSRLPDLNLRSSAVRNELEAILRYWLELGVDGFRVMDVKFLFEDADLNDEIVICSDDDDYNCLDHDRTTSQPEVYEIVSTWREILQEYSTENERILLTDARETVNTTMLYYGRGTNNGAQLPFNYGLMSLTASTTGRMVADAVGEYVEQLPGYGTADWMTDYQDDRRLVSIMGEHFAGALAVLKTTLPGTSIVYYGEELGMVDGTLSNAESQDPSGLNRDNYRTLMQWDSSVNGGFSNGTNSSVWVPINDDYPLKNVQLLDDDTDSIINVYRRLNELLRTSDGLAYGSLEYATVDDDIFSYVRQYDGTDRYLIAINFGAQEVTTDLTSGTADVPNSAELLLSTSGPVSERDVGDSVNLREVKLADGQAAIFIWPFSR